MQRGLIRGIGEVVLQDGELWGTGWYIAGGDYPGISLSHGLAGWSIEDLKVIADAAAQFDEATALRLAETLRDRPAACTCEPGTCVGVPGYVPLA